MIGIDPVTITLSILSCEKFNVLIWTIFICLVLPLHGLSSLIHIHFTPGRLRLLVIHAVHCVKAGT